MSTYRARTKTPCLCYTWRLVYHQEPGAYATASQSARQAAFAVGQAAKATSNGPPPAVGNTLG